MCPAHGLSSLDDIMTTSYRHRQPGTLSLIFLGIAVLSLLIAAGLTQGSAVILLVLALTLVAALIFSSLTAEVAGGELIWYFGPGFWRYRQPLSEIVSAKAVTNPWWYGWGIRYTPEGWLYNVSGSGAVEILRKDGKRRRIGTDEPDALARAIMLAAVQRGG